MKKPEAFAHKRKVRDKANLRWIKNRHLVVPAFGALLLMGGLIGGNLAMRVNPDLTGTGVLAGMVLGFAVGAPLVVRSLCN